MVVAVSNGFHSAKGHLVDLIPADVDRLQPSKTKTYVFIAVVLTLLLAFLTFFLIYPRPFNLKTNDEEGRTLYPIDLHIDTVDEIVRFKIRNWWYIENPNYYSIHLTSLNIQAFMNERVNETSINSVVTIPMRSKTKIYAVLQITFKDDLSYMVKFCNDDKAWVHTMIMRFQAIAIVNSMGYNYTSIQDTYQYVSCGRDKTKIVGPPNSTSLPTTGAPLTTTTA